MSDPGTALQQALAEVDRLRAMERTNSQLRETIREQRWLVDVLTNESAMHQKSAGAWKSAALAFSVVAAIVGGLLALAAGVLARKL